MGNRLYVGNLPYTVTDDQLKEAFAPHGEVTSASVVMDRATGRSRGFGFVEMSTPEQATKATEQMNGALFEGRPLTVNEARERAPRTGGPRPFNGNGGDRGGFRSDGGGDRGGFRGAPGGDRGGAGPGPGGWGGGDRGAPPADRGGWDGGAGGRGPDKRRERDRSDRDEGGKGGRGGGGRGGW